MSIECIASDLDTAEAAVKHIAERGLRVRQQGKGTYAARIDVPRGPCVVAAAPIQFSTVIGQVSSGDFRVVGTQREVVVCDVWVQDPQGVWRVRPERFAIEDLLGPSIRGELIRRITASVEASSTGELGSFVAAVVVTDPFTQCECTVRAILDPDQLELRLDEVA